MTESGHAGDGAAWRPRASRQPAGCGRWSRPARAAATDPGGSAAASCISSCRATPRELVTYPAPEPDPERPVLFDDEIEVDARRRAPGSSCAARRSRSPLGSSARDPARRAGDPLRAAPRTRRRSPARGPTRARGTCTARWCARRSRSCSARRSIRRGPQVVVKVDRSGLNEHHPLVQRLYAAIERVLRPIVDAEERRAGAHLVGPPARSARATRSGCARSTTRSRARSTRRGHGPACAVLSASDRPPSEPRPDEQPMTPRAPSSARHGASNAASPSARCASSSPRSGCIPASSAASRCSSTLTRVAARDADRDHVPTAGLSLSRWATIRSPAQRARLVAR